MTGGPRRCPARGDPTSRSPMDSPAAASREFRFDAFISYSHKDRAFSRRLEQELGRYRPPRDLRVPQRSLRIFRDEADFTGGEYHEALDRNLRDASKLIVICSPNSASSDYVTEEISRFVEYRGKEHIVPVLLDGVPNNEARSEDAGRKAFPEQLVRLLPMPLAADYRGFDSQRDAMRKGAFAPAWFKTLADVYADYGIDRAQIEQRERRREVQRLRTIAAVSSAVAIALVGLTIWALVSRHEATRQRDNAEARRNETEARLAFDDSGDGLARAALLSVTSVRLTRTVDGQIAVTRFLGLLPRPPLWRTSVAPPASVTAGGRQRALAVSPDGSRLAVAGGDGPVRLLDAHTGHLVGSVEVPRDSAGRTVLAFSPDAAFLVLGCARRACVIDVARGQLLTRLPSAQAPFGSMVWSASFSSDGRQLALASYGSNEVLVYDVPAWRQAGTIRPGTGSVFSVAFSRTGEWLATGTPTGLQLWRIGYYDAPAAQVALSDTFWSIAFQPDGSGLVVAGRRLQAWTIASGDAGAVRLEAGASSAIAAHTVLAVSRRDRPCFAAAAADAVHLLCSASLDEVMRVPVSSAAAAVSSDGQWLLNEDPEGALAAWPISAGPDALRIPFGVPVRSMATAARADWLAGSTDSGEIAVVGLETWKERTRLRPPEPAGPVTKVVASSDGRWLVAAKGTSLHVYDASTWREVAPRTYGDAIAGVAFDAGDRRLVAVTGTTVVVWQP